MLITRKKILILGRISTDGLDDNITTAEAEYSANFTEQEKKF